MINMTWKDILKTSGEREDLEIEFDQLLQMYGEGKDREDYEYDTSNYQRGEDINIETDWEEIEDSSELGEEELFENDKGYYRISFTIAGAEAGVADYTLKEGYTVHEINLDTINDGNLAEAIKELTSIVR